MLEFGGRGPRLPELRRQFGRLDRHGVAFRLSRRELDFESGQPVPKLIGAGSLGIPARLGTISTAYIVLLVVQMEAWPPEQRIGGLLKRPDHQPVAPTLDQPAL